MDPTQKPVDPMGAPAPVVVPPVSTPAVDPMMPPAPLTGTPEPTPVSEVPEGEQPKVEETPGGTTPPPVPTSTV